jgi:hypothetical protein
MYLLEVTMNTKAPITDVVAQRRHNHHGGGDVLLAGLCGCISGGLGGPALASYSLACLITSVDHFFEIMSQARR